MGSIETKVSIASPFAISPLTLYCYTGSGVAPFFPIAPPASNPLLGPCHVVCIYFTSLGRSYSNERSQFLFFLRLPFLIFAWTVWLLMIRWTPAGGLLRKANLWCILGIPGVWFVDIRVDGVQRGFVNQNQRIYHSILTIL